DVEAYGFSWAADWTLLPAVRARDTRESPFDGRSRDRFHARSTGPDAGWNHRADCGTRNRAEPQSMVGRGADGGGDDHRLDLHHPGLRNSRRAAGDAARDLREDEL